MDQPTRGEDPRVQFGGKLSPMFSLGKPLPRFSWVVGGEGFPVFFVFVFFEGFFVARFWWVLGNNNVSTFWEMMIMMMFF